MLVVSDTSPISSLIQINRIEILRDLFGTVCIPPAVRDELIRFHPAVPAFVEVRAILDQSKVECLRAMLHQGEAEAIALACECHADYLLIDERRGRLIAAEQAVPTIGLLGVLLFAKQRSLVASVKECLLDLRGKAGFYISDALMQRILDAAQELTH